MQVRCALAALLVAVMLVPVAGAGAASDRDAVIKDYSSGRNITACAFTLGQLENVLGQLGPDINVYAPGLNAAIKREIQRWKAGECKGKKGAAVDVRIVKIKFKGGARSESVTLKNFGAKNVSLRRYRPARRLQARDPLQEDDAQGRPLARRRHRLSQGLEGRRAQGLALLRLSQDAVLG